MNAVDTRLLSETLAQLSEVAPEVRDAFAKRVRAVPGGLGIRAAFAAVTAPTLQRIAPAQVEPFETFAAHVPATRGLFSFQPLRHLMMQLAVVGQLCWPGRDLDEAANAIVEAAADLIWATPIMGPFVAAFEDNIAQLVEVVASAGRIFYDHGTLEYERRGAREVVVFYEGVPFDALRMWIPGFWLGTLRWLGLDGEVRFLADAPTWSESVIRWR